MDETKIRRDAYSLTDIGLEKFLADYNKANLKKL